MCLTSATLLACAGLGSTQRPTATVPMPTTPASQITPLTQPPTEAASLPSPEPSRPILAGYYPGWAADRYPVANIPADQLTHILYAFADVSPDGECISNDPEADAANWQALRQLRQQHPRLSVLISVGGWTQSGRFSDVAATPQARAQFAESCRRLVAANGFDGLDVDWEFPVSGGLPTNHYRPDDGQNFTALLAELRRALDAQGQADGRHYALTIAAPAGPSEYGNLELNAIHSSLDWINLMTYDFYTAESPITNFNAPLYTSSSDPAPEARRLAHNADAAVQAYLSAGVPARKLVLGAPFYGRGWQGVPPDNDGLYQPDAGPASGTDGEAGYFSYADLKQRFLPSYARHFHAEARVPWLYDPATGIFITYEDPESLGDKADYALAHSLGGMMFWELSQDDEQHSLLEALRQHLFR